MSVYATLDTLVMERFAHVSNCQLHFIALYSRSPLNVVDRLILLPRNKQTLATYLKAQ